MSIRKFFGDLASKNRTPDYRVIRSSIPITTTPDKTTREKIVELFNQYSQHESVFEARYIGSHKIHDPRDTQLVHLAIDLVRDGKRSLGGKKRPVELRMKLGSGVSVFDEGGATLKLCFPVYKLVYASKAPDNRMVFMFICDVSSKENKAYRMYAFKSDEKTADRVIKTLKEMYFVVHKIHRAKKRKKRELERRRSEVPTLDSELPLATVATGRPLSTYLSEHALDEHQGVFPTTFGASATHVTSELDSMIEELSIETKSLEKASLQAANNPFICNESNLFSFDDNFSETVPSAEAKATNRFSFYDSFSCNSVDNIATEPSGAGASPTIDEEFISIAKRNVLGPDNSGSRSNSFTKLFQRERTNSYSKIESNLASKPAENETGTEDTTVANPFSELSPPKSKILSPNT